MLNILVKERNFHFRESIISSRREETKIYISKNACLIGEMNFFCASGQGFINSLAIENILAPLAVVHPRLALVFFTKKL